jgi:hypothetical protein
MKRVLQYAEHLLFARRSKMEHHYRKFKQAVIRPENRHRSSQPEKQLRKRGACQTIIFRLNMDVSKPALLDTINNINNLTR